MHFDQREQTALRAAGMATDEIEAVSADVAAAADREATRLSSFFDRDVVYSDMDRAHSDSEVHEHDLSFVDIYTHADEIRGYVRFDSWGAWIADGRVLRPTGDEPAPGALAERAETAPAAEPTLVELTLGPTIHDRVRFAPDPEEL